MPHGRPAFVVGVACLILPGTAFSTVAVGTEARLLGVGGEGHRYAIIAEVDAQDPECESASCRVYHLDLTQPDFARLLPRPVQVATVDGRKGTILSSYLDALPAEARERLRRNAISAANLRSPTPTVEAGSLAMRFGELRVRASLRQLWSVASMNAFDRHDEQALQCVDFGRQTALCSACRKTVRWVDGDRLDTWECGDVGKRVDGPSETEEAEAEGPLPCECGARAHMYALELSDGRRVVLGSKLLVEPYRTQQDLVGRPGQWVDDTGLNDGTGASTVHFAVTPEGYIIVTGSAVHFPIANSVSFPVVAVWPAPTDTGGSDPE